MENAQRIKRGALVVQTATRLLRLAARLLEKAGYLVSFTRPGEKRGDLRELRQVVREAVLRARLASAVRALLGAAVARER